VAKVCENPSGAMTVQRADGRVAVSQTSSVVAQSRQRSLCRVSPALSSICTSNGARHFLHRIVSPSVGLREALIDHPSYSVISVLDEPLSPLARGLKRAALAGESRVFA
jgi:hypothetical protein